MPTYTDLKKKGTNEIVYPNIQGQNIPDSAISTAKIATGAVTETKIATGAVTDSKIASNAVSTAKIADGAITTAKLGALAVTNGKIANSAVTKSKLNLYIKDIGSELASASPTTLHDVMSWFQAEIMDDLFGSDLFLTCFRINTSGGEYEFETCQFTYDTDNIEVYFTYDNGGSQRRITCNSDAGVAQFLQDVQGVYIVYIGG